MELTNIQISLEVFLARMVIEIFLIKNPIVSFILLHLPIPSGNNKIIRDLPLCRLEAILNRPLISRF
jgi:hypothetical protein